jgi:DNA-binding winged helix-turn-helix (wHTH) protein
MIALRERSQAEGNERFASEAAGGTVDELRFKDYRLLPSSRILLKGRVPVTIGSRAFDILTVLLRARGCIVGKREIVKAVWPTTIVEESNLRFQVAQLRKALGDDQDLIKTIPGRGYLFALEAEAATSSPLSRTVPVLDSDACRGATAVSLAASRRASDDAPPPAKGLICTEGRILLQKFIETLGVEDGGAVIVYVRLSE